MRRLAACCLLALFAAASPAPAGGALEEGAVRTAAGLAALEAGDEATALRQLELGARAGNRLAAYSLAMLLLAGSGPADEQAAWGWLRRAATAGLPEAQLAFARLYDQGRRVPPSPSTAVHFYRLAAEQGMVDAQLNLGTLYFLGRGIGQDYGQAARWFLAAAQGGDPGAQYLIAHMFEEGYGVNRDLDQARHWYAEAARQGDVLAASRLQALLPPER